ncbi:hypothetical protein HAX54_038627 [Datura stramonium]|uniref:Uncharacterized protein n=1 Tax=Datura stramonium TaxID=4076 RepID=A0ABS8SI61_DATST|nr:hypothetical protein [Datura stramonium]
MALEYSLEELHQIHPPVIGAFPLDREPFAESLHLIKWLAKEKIDVLDPNKLRRISIYILLLGMVEDVLSRNKKELERVKGITRECHHKSLSDVQQCFIDAKEKSTKANGCMEDLQATLAKIEKELKTLSMKRKKTMTHTDEQRRQLSKNQENIIGFESEIRAIKENGPLSEDEIEKFFKLKETVER